MNRVLARIVAIAAVVVAAVLVCAHLALRAQSDADAAADAHRREVDALTAALVGSASVDDVHSALARTEPGREGRAAVHLPGGVLVGVAHSPPAAVRAAEAKPMRVEDDDGPILLAPVTTRAGRAVVEVARGRAPGWRLAESALLACAGAVGALAALGATRWSRQALVRDVAALGAAARALGPGRAVRPPLAGSPPELVELAASLASAAERWSALRVDENNLLADLSHRMRTPLTVLRLEAGAVRPDEVAARIQAALDVLEDALDGVIAGPPAEPMAVADPDAPTDVAAVVRDRMVYWGPLLGAQGRPVEVDLPRDAPLARVTSDDLAETLDTLLVNIVRYTAPGNPVAVRVVRHARWITVAVEDGGPGILDPDRALARGASTGGSTGLGLDIARGLAESSGGSIHVERSGYGGVRVRLRLPEHDGSAAPEGRSTD